MASPGFKPPGKLMEKVLAVRLPAITNGVIDTLDVASGVMLIDALPLRTKPVGIVITTVNCGAAVVFS